MASYVVLGNYTEQGIKNMKGLSARLDAVKQMFQAAGGSMIAWYLTFGAYDFVAVLEVPDAQTAARLTLMICGQGNVRTTTMQALTEAEAISVANALP